MPIAANFGNDGGGGAGASFQSGGCGRLRLLAAFRLRSTELRARAGAEVDELGPEPADPHDRALWAEERRGACVLFAAFADWDPSLCRRAAVEVAEWADPVVRDLLLDAAECANRR